MEVLPQSKKAFDALLANRMAGPGMHTHPQPRSGGQGVVIGEVEFDPLRHSLTDILPASVMQEALGQPQVADVLPSRPFNISVLADFRGDRSHPAVLDSRRNLVAEAADSIRLSKPTLDRIHSFHVGIPPDNMVIDSEITRGGNEGVVLAQSALNLCSRGLAVVISKFSDLPIAYTGQRLDNLIAVKVNHPAERRIPTNVGVISLGRGFEVNTHESAQVDAVNRDLDRQHQAIVDPLVQAGAQVVDLIWDPNYPNGFDANTSDNGIATAVNAYAKSKH